MTSTDYQPPDLTTVLATLAAYAPPQPPAPQYTSPQLQPPHEELDLDEDEYDPSNFDPSVSQPAVIPQPVTEAPATTESPIRPQASSSGTRTFQNTSSLLESASKILSWPPALRFVMKNIMPNPAVAHRVKHLIRTQHQHERQWWSGREALLQKQREREAGRKKLDDVLASVGGIVNTINHETSPQTDINELNLYDRKVHRACKEMNAATTAELTRLGIPFFAIDKTLITQDTGQDREEKAKIEEKVLEELKIKMLGLLEDLCGD